MLGYLDISVNTTKHILYLINCPGLFAPYAFIKTVTRIQFVYFLDLKTKHIRNMTHPLSTSTRVAFAILF